MIKPWLQGALALALVSACEGGHEDTDRDHDHDHDSDHAHAGQSAGQTAGSQADEAAGPTFTLLFDSVFSTCRNPMCHGGGVTGGLDMGSKRAAYDALVDHASSPTSICAMLGKKRVVPGDPDQSLLYLKLTVDAPCGQQMPPGGQLKDEQREQVRAWIEAGAKDN